MIDHDVEARRMFVQERRVALGRDALRVTVPRTEMTESRIRPRRRRLRLMGLRLQLRAARSGA